MTLLTVCMCGGRRGGKTLVLDSARMLDAKIANRDPTSTLPLRRQFQMEMDKRWTALAKLVTAAVGGSDILGLGGPNVENIRHSAQAGPHPQLPHGDKVRSFQTWFDEALRQTVYGNTGAWVTPYIQKAMVQAATRAVKLTSDKAATANAAKAQALISLTQVELQGIIEAVSQQVVREATSGILLGMRPAKIVRMIRAKIKAVGQVRGRVLVQFMVVKAFSSATLDAFRAAGVKKVGTQAEKIRVVKGAHGKTRVKDAPPVKGPGSRSSRAETPSPAVIAQIEKAQSKIEELGEVDVLTAGDDDVCPECEEISDDGPYDIDEAESLIPAHPFCRCAFVPTSDERFASDAYDPDEARDDHGMWSAGGGGSETARSWAKQGKDLGLASKFSGGKQVVYHGVAKGHERVGFLFVTRDKAGAATHGDVQAFAIKHGATIYPDLEANKTRTGSQTLLEGKANESSGIIHANDLVPTKSDVD